MLSTDINHYVLPCKETFSQNHRSNPHTWPMADFPLVKKKKSLKMQLLLIAMFCVLFSCVLYSHIDSAFIRINAVKGEVPWKYEKKKRNEKAHCIYTKIIFLLAILSLDKHWHVKILYVWVDVLYVYVCLHTQIFSASVHDI